MSPRDPMAAARPVVHERSGGMCERCCARRATDVHHRKLRRHGDHKPANLVHLCRECHNRVHEHRDEATAAGFIVSGQTDPRTIPLAHGLYGRVRLLDDGTYRRAA